MPMRKTHAILYLFLSGCLLAGSCSKMSSSMPDGDRYGPSADAEGMEQEEYDAIVTVKQAENQSVYFQVDDVSRLYPLNYEQPYTGPKRLACSLIEYKNRTVDNNRNYHLGLVKWFEEVVPGRVEAAGEDGATYQPDDGIDVLDDWMTSLEDAFLTIHYSTFWGDGSVAYRLVLVKTGPADFRLLLYRNGDEKLEEGDALVCFDLNEYLPQTDGMDITLKWSTGAGEPSEKVFRFRSRP